MYICDYCVALIILQVLNFANFVPKIFSMKKILNRQHKQQTAHIFEMMSTKFLKDQLFMKI